MSTFTVDGLSSGISYSDMISKILELERQPITLMQSRQTAYSKQISVYGDLSSKLSALKTAADALRTTSKFSARKASSSDPTVFEAAAGSSAAAGNYNIAVTALAQAHRIASSTVSAVTDAVSSAGGNFSFQVGSGAVATVTVTPTTTLSELKDAINAAKGDAEASVLYDGTGYRLVLTSKVSGAANAISVTENVTSLALPSGPVAGGTTLQAAQDARFTIDGLPMTRSTNTVSDAITGVSFTLKKAGTGTLSVTTDADAIRQKLEAFVSAYNDVVTLVSDNSAYNTTTKKGGPLAGESTARGVLDNLRRIVGGRVEGLPEGLRVLAQAGVKSGRDGKLSIDSAVLDDRIASNLSGVSDLFTSAGGVANRVWEYVDRATNAVSGPVKTRKKGLEKTVAKIDDDIAKIEDRLSREKEEMQQRFAKLEALLTTLSSQGTYLTSLLNKSG